MRKTVGASISGVVTWVFVEALLAVTDTAVLR
jgi:hypothetical protein